MNTTYKVSIGPSLDGKIPPGSPFWSKFNGAFKNLDIPAAQFANLIYEKHPFTTWHKDNWRRSDNYLLGQHIGVDFDTGDVQSSIPHLLSDPFVAKYASIVYATPSHTPEEPRARVVFLLDQPVYQPKNYVLAVSTILWLFGSAADRQCKDPVRFFYGGRKDENIEFLDNVLPLEKLKEMIIQYKRTGHQERSQQGKPYKAQTTDERTVQEALRHIPPWAIEYQEWLSILMAIHSEYPGNNGLALAENWGQGVNGEITRKWKSFDSSGNVSGQVTLGTLFDMAKQHGWQRQMGMVN